MHSPLEFYCNSPLQGLSGKDKGCRSTNGSTGRIQARHAILLLSVLQFVCSCAATIHHSCSPFMHEDPGKSYVICQELFAVLL